MISQTLDSVIKGSELWIIDQTLMHSRTHSTSNIPFALLSSGTPEWMHDRHYSSAGTSDNVQLCVAACGYISPPL